MKRFAYTLVTSPQRNRDGDSAGACADVDYQRVRTLLQVIEGQLDE